MIIFLRVRWLHIYLIFGWLLGDQLSSAMSLICLFYPPEKSPEHTNIDFGSLNYNENLFLLLHQRIWNLWQHHTRHMYLINKHAPFHIWKSRTACRCISLQGIHLSTEIFAKWNISANLCQFSRSGDWRSRRAIQDRRWILRVQWDLEFLLCIRRALKWRKKLRKHIVKLYFFISYKLMKF